MATKRGGKRPGAGRPKGAKSRKRKRILEIVSASGKTPLDVMLDAMRRLYEDRRFIDAADIARMAAPYVHPRLSAIEHSGTDGQPLIPKEFTIKFVRTVAPGLNPDGSDPA